jgi:hypothetical protein
MSNQIDFLRPTTGINEERVAKMREASKAEGLKDLTAKLIASGMSPKEAEKDGHGPGSWAYTNLADPRWLFTKKYMSLRQDPNNPDAQKLGLFNQNTWAA